MGASKVSITVDEEMLAEAKRYAGSNLSSWMNDALTQKVKLERARAFLAEERSSKGDIPRHLIEEVGSNWPE